MKILLTGSNGFLGKIIHKYITIDNVVQTLNRSNSTYNCNLSIDSPNLDNDIEVVIHSAGLAHVQNCENEQYLLNNIVATENLLFSLEKCNTLNKIIFISSVSVYGLSSGENISEEHPLLAKDPYGASKIEAEKLIINWCNSNQINYIILRLPLVIGHNPPGNLKNMIKGIKLGYYFNIGLGNAKKSMVLGEDIAKIILEFGNQSSIYNLTDGDDPSFFQLSHAISKKYNYKNPKSLPFFIAKLISILGDYLGSNFILNSKKFSKINSTLTFSNAKATHNFGWAPTKVLDYFN